MDSDTQTRCLSIFEGVMTSVLGHEIVNYFISALPGKEIPPSIMNVKNKLEQNEYSSPNEYLEDVHSSFCNVAKEVGIQTDIGLSILNLSKMIEEDTVSTLKINASDTIKTHINKCPNISEIIEALEDFTKIAPNNLEEFQKFIDDSSKETLVFPENHVEVPFTRCSAIDPVEICKQINELPEDGQMSKVIDIITRYEISYQHIRNILEIDLAKCQPNTLQLIKNYLMEVKSNSSENSTVV